MKFEMRGVANAPRFFMKVVTQVFLVTLKPRNLYISPVAEFP